MSQFNESTSITPTSFYPHTTIYIQCGYWRQYNYCCITTSVCTTQSIQLNGIHDNQLHGVIDTYAYIEPPMSQSCTESYL